MRVKQFGVAFLLLAATASVARSQAVTAPIIVTPLGASPADYSGTPNPPFTPAQVQQAYGLNLIQSGATNTGAGQTIAIVDAYNYPNALSTFNTFSTTFGLPLFNQGGGPTFTQLNELGGTTLPGTDPTAAPNDTWEYE